MSFGMCRNTYTFHDICDRFIKKTKTKRNTHHLFRRTPLEKCKVGETSRRLIFMISELKVQFQSGAFFPPVPEGSPLAAASLFYGLIDFV